ncbi:DUF6084 family protein [Gandjariella thermophila]|uniref:Uncharacterized protein n=1 Tax=Gandjariella thermophila TaxID=1931992 RepID=A0A4D4J2B6_9PSEU|nr:DUF6084 family protein [Gandjariella thermophila]GDY28759.1 hypothetical protein GTS_03920 [Gandjariella thermophila]
MTDLSFDCVDVAPQRLAAAPTLLFRLRIGAPSGLRIHAIALRVQIHIEPRQREYSAEEGELLGHLFDEPGRWGQPPQSLELANTSIMVPGFVGSTEIELPVPCTYDLEVAAGKYLHALEDGAVPMVLMFSGTVFGRGDTGFWVEQVPWRHRTAHRMPVRVWRELMDLYFPDAAWIRVHRDTLDALLRYKAGQSLPTWDTALASLLPQDATP